MKFVPFVLITTISLASVFSAADAGVMPRSTWQNQQTAQQASEENTDVVGNRRLPTGKLIQPFGATAEFHGRPVDVELFEGRLLVKDRKSLRIFDCETMKQLQELPSPGGASLTGLLVDATGTVYFSNSKQEIHRFEKTDDPNAPFRLKDSIKLPAGCFPCGMALNKTTLFVCLSKRNSIGMIDLTTGKLVKEIPVGIAPYTCEIAGSRLLVTNIGGELPQPNELTAPSAGTETKVDKRGIAKEGSLSIVDLDSEDIRSVPTGRQPSGMTTIEDRVFVVNTNDDSLFEIALTEAEKTRKMSLRPMAALPFGSMPSDILLDQKNGRFFATLAGNNSVGIYATSDGSLQGLIPTGWYPIALCGNDEFLFVANVKGNGSRSRQRAEAKGWNSHDHLGSVQRIAISAIETKADLDTLTNKAKALARMPQILRNLEQAEIQPDVQPQPVPKNLGEPSVFQHVIYVIKENRTFDQVFGDVAEARSDPTLCLFPKAITPNHHALAERFGLLDNYYCNGVLSADGHSWATEGNVTPYLERAFGGFARSYTFGDDPLTYSSTGFLWDRFLDAGLSFRNYGEFNYATPPEGMKYQDIWKAYQANQQIEFKHNIGVKRVRDFSCLDYPGWNMQIPDVLRMDRFLAEFRNFEKDGTLPNLTLIYLPQDHLGGGITSRSHMADNDLALGRLVDAVSHSKFWKNTVIFVNEDDPQNGFDHIDGHRSLCLVISPYSRRGINHHFHNQTSVLRTMLHIFGLPPLNQQDASTELMSDCFQSAADLTPFDAITPDIPLNEAPQPKEKQTALEKRWREILATVPIERTGMKTEEDEANLNRFIWYEVKGWDTPYPSALSGPHGKGLQALGLELDMDADED